RRDADFLAGWADKPLASRHYDLVHGHLPQSSQLSEPEQLVRVMANLRDAHPDPQHPPEELAQLVLHPDWLEVLRIDEEERLHDRRRWRLEDAVWHEQGLGP